MALAWPIFVEQGLRFLIMTVDTFMVSHLSDGAVAALGMAGQVLFLCVVLFNFIAIGSSVVITHHLGAGDADGARRIASAAIGVNTWVGLVVSTALAVGAGPLLRLLQLPPELHPYARPFLVILGGTLFLDAQSVAMAAVLRAHRHTRDAMLVTGGQNILNAAGNCLLLFGLLGFPRLGVTGVAISGVFARVAGFVALRILVHRRTGIWLGWRDYLSSPLGRVRRILRIGLPAAGENLSYWVALILVTSFASRLGPTPLATLVYTRNLNTWVMLSAISIGLGTEILVGHLIGAGLIEEAYRSLLRSLRTGLLLAVLAAGAVALAGPRLLRIFTDDPAVIAAGAVLLWIGLVHEPGRVFNIVVINSLRATGDAVFPVVMGASSMWLLWVPLAWVLSQHTPLGVTGIWIAMACDEWLRGTMMVMRWRSRRWEAHARDSRRSLAEAEPAAVVGEL
jgi:putative MATE family efflux protein